MGRSWFGSRTVHDDEVGDLPGVWRLLAPFGLPLVDLSAGSDEARRSVSRRSHETTAGRSAIFCLSASNRRRAPRRTTIPTAPGGGVLVRSCGFTGAFLGMRATASLSAATVRYFANWASRDGWLDGGPPCSKGHSRAIFRQLVWIPASTDFGWPKSLCANRLSELGWAGFSHEQHEESMTASSALVIGPMVTLLLLASIGSVNAQNTDAVGKTSSPSVEIGTGLSGLFPSAGLLGPTLRVTGGNGGRFSLEGGVDWTDAFNPQDLSEQVMWFYFWQVKHTLRSDRTSSLFASYGTAGLTGRTLVSPGQVDAWLLPPILPIVGLGWQRVVATRMAASGGRPDCGGTIRGWKCRASYQRRGIDTDPWLCALICHM